MTPGTKVRHGNDSGEVLGKSGNLVSVLLYTRRAVIQVEASELEVTYTPEQAEEMAQRESARPRGYSGFRFGQPQCDGCRRFLKAYNQACPNCGGYARPRDGARGARRG